MRKFLCLMLAMAGLTLVASAQQNDPGGAGDHAFPLINRVLTDAQRQSLQQIMAPQRDQVRSLAEKMRASRDALFNQAASGNFNEGTVREYAEQSARAEADLMVMYARALSQMQPPLSAQQIAQIKNYQGGRFAKVRKEEDAPAAPEVHMQMPPALPRDTNDLPVVN
jgi:Spy/CpxP family protein refolding chaperone